MRTNRGVTLVELIICLAIASIVLSATATSFSSIRESGRGTAALNWILAQLSTHGKQQSSATRW